MSLDVTIRGADKLRAVARALREADKVTLGRQLGKAIKDAAKPTLDDLRRSARDIKTTGYRKPGATRPFTAVVAPKGTRAKIAAACAAEVRLAGDDPRVRFRVQPTKLPEPIRTLPRKFDSAGTWRHPVMGNREAWVGQSGDPWFWPPIRDNIGTFRAEIDKALDAVKEKIERS